MMKPFYQDNHNTLYCLDFRKNELPDECVQAVCTSPPYWGLRKYSGEQDLIWGGDENCEHRWDVKAPPRRKRSEADIKDPTSKQETHTANAYNAVDTNFCSLCGAWKGAYGLEPQPEMYIQHTVEILREIRRVLRKDGVVFWNIGDSYSATRWSNTPSTSFNPPAADIVLQKQTNLPPKNLCLIPFRVAIAAQEDGWWVRSVIIWSKNNPMPESVTDRPTESHEYLLMLTQSGKSLYWTHRDGGGTRQRPKPDYRWVNQITGEEVAIEPPDWKAKIKCPACEATGIVSVYLGLDVWQDKKCDTCHGKKETQMWKRINLWKGHDYYWDQEAVRKEYTEPLNRWGGDTLKRETKKTAAYKDEILHLSPSSAMRAGNPIRPDPSGRNIRSVWTFPTQPFPQAHFAVFPEKLPELCIKAATPEVGCCSKCGAPWERIVERTGHTNKREPAHVPDNTPTKTDSTGWGPVAMGTNSWQPTCSCNADKIPSLVLDPFAGAGTTLLVAKKLNRRATGYDTAAEYCELTVKRLMQQVML